MRRKRDTPLQPAASHQWMRSAHSSLVLRSPDSLAEVAFLSHDLLRLRFTSRRRFSTRPSRAVLRQDRPRIKVQFRQSKSGLVAATDSLRFEFNLRSGGWQLSGMDGRSLFEADQDSCGFLRRAPRVTLKMAPGEKVFGLGETTGPYDRRGSIREFWNTDVLAGGSSIHPALRRLYVSIPFATSWRNGRMAGLFWDNPARQIWDVGQTRLDRWQMTAASGEIDLYLFGGPDAQSIISRYAELTGHTPLPPRWALGYHQSRYSYESRERVEEIARQFRRRRIPCDALYLDIHHMDGDRVFTFGKAFAKPALLIKKLAQQGFRAVTIVDPGVKNDPAFGVLKRGRRANAFVKLPDGRHDYIGEVWPGPVRFPDFLKARTRDWWGGEQSRLLRLGVAGFWNDMNEPADFSQSGKTIPDNCRHDTDHGLMRHAEAHNVYGLEMARASREGALKYQPGRRPFIISRSGYAGVQRHALVWTGDNSSTWEQLGDALQMCLNLGLSGVPFCGADVGGFLENCTPELLTRWTQMAAFMPFFRNHTNIGTIPQEPWAFGPAVEAICRRHIELRYQLLPYLYCLFVEAHRTGAPIMRPLLWQHGKDPVAVATGDQFLLGNELMVAPILRQGAEARSVYLPRGRWFNFLTGEKFQGGQHVITPAALESIPLFVRAGGIIPMGAVTQHSNERPWREINLHVWTGGRGRLLWREDDGESMNHESGAFNERTITCRLASDGTGAISLSRISGSYESAITTWRVIVRGAARKLRIKVNNSTRPSRYDRISGICSFEMPNLSSAIKIRLN